jgi:curved DNA-binding protein CbpA
MEHVDFVDYYTVLEVSPSASPETIERVFRELARRFHPDNRETGDRTRFDAVLEANNTLKHPVRRAQYDATYQDHLKSQPDRRPDLNGREDIGRDVDIQHKLLSVLYVRRRENIRNPGIGHAELARHAGCSYDHLEFHLWFLKEKGWIGKGEDGLFAITIDGVERANNLYREITAKKLIADQS